MTPSGIVIRKAVPADAPHIGHLHVVCWQEAYKDLMPEDYLRNLNVEKRSLMWSNKITSNIDDEFILVAENSANEIIGFASGGRFRENSELAGEIYAIYALKSYYNQGVGSALWQHSCELLRQYGHSRGYLWVLQGNIRAIEFYQRKNCHLNGQIKTKSMGEVTLTELCYQWDLST